MHVAKRLSLSIGSAIAAAGLALAAAPSASAAPTGPTLTATSVSVYQFPAIGLKVSGLVVPGPLITTVNASSPQAGQTTFTSPASPETCATTAGGTLVRINYVNLTNGIRGTTTVKPCPNYIDLTPVARTVRTGSGPVAITVEITGSWAYPRAGQPSLPGVGGFVAP